MKLANTQANTDGESDKMARTKKENRHRMHKEHRHREHKQRMHRSKKSEKIPFKSVTYKGVIEMRPIIKRKSTHEDRKRNKEIHKDRVRKYMKEKYGDKAFTKSGKLKISALRRAKKELKNEHKTSLERAVTEAINFDHKRMRE